MNKPIATVVIRNRGTSPLALKRAGHDIELPLEFLGGHGVKLYKENAFISINFDTREVVFDFGEVED